MRPNRLFLVCSSSLALLAAPAAAQEVPPDAPVIANAAEVHVSAAGLQALGEGIAAVLPTELGVTGLEGEFDCDPEAPGVLEYAVEPLTVNISTDNVSISPSTGRLDINLDMTLWSEEVQVTADGECLFTLNEVCTFELAPTALNADIAVLLQLENGQLAATVDSFSFTHGNFGNPIGTGCILGDALETLNGYGIDLIGSVLDDVLDSQLGELETQLDDTLGGFAQAVALEGETEILDAVLAYNLAATELAIDATGLRIGFEAQFSTPAYGACVPKLGAYVPSAHDAPPLTGLLPGTDAPYHVGITVSQDTINEALYAAWQGGVFCLSLGDLAPVPLDTGTLMGQDIPEVLDEVWGDEPLVLDIRVSGDQPPVAIFEGGPKIFADLAVDVYGEELDRPTRHWGHGLVADVPIDADITAGEVILDIGFDLETSLGVSVTYNEWLPAAIPEQFAANLPGLISVGLSTQGLDLEAGLVPPFAMPGFNGLTLTDLDVRVIGTENDYLGVFGWIDPTEVTAFELGTIELDGVGCGDTGGGGDIVIPGCEDGAGCDASTGCGGGEEGGCGGCGDEEGGCGCSSTGRGAPGLFLVWLLPPLLLLRRRR
ncbi:MAG: hypothetical protein KDA24_14465 [Deltaproteobacteria bacterium]|nr:hypothetical protein [Deltaproteobacteria bacterium]